MEYDLNGYAKRTAANATANIAAMPILAEQNGFSVPNQINLVADNSAKEDNAVDFYIPSFDKIQEQYTGKPASGVDGLFAVSGFNASYTDPTTGDSLKSIAMLAAMAKTNAIKVKKIQLILIDSRTSQSVPELSFTAFTDKGSYEKPTAPDRLQFNLITTGGLNTTNYLETVSPLNYTIFSNSSIKFTVPAFYIAQVIIFVDGVIVAQ